MNNQLEKYGPANSWQPPEYNFIDSRAAELFVNYTDWLAYRRGYYGAGLHNGNVTKYFDEMDINDLAGRMFNFKSCFYPAELAYNIIKFEAKCQNKSMKQVYHAYRKCQNIPEDQGGRLARLIIGCLLHSGQHNRKLVLNRKPKTWSK